MSEKKLNKQIDDLLETIEGTLPKKYGRLTRATDKARLAVEDILAKHADADGKVPRNKQATVIRDLQRVESQLYRDIRTELQAIFAETSDTMSAGLALALYVALDTATLLEFAGLAEALGETAELLFSALIGRDTYKFSKDMAKTPFNRKDDDGLQLNDRLRDIARVIVRQVSSTLRQSIRNGEVTSRMNQKVKRDFSSLAWRLKTLVETEILYIHRNAIGMFAEYSGIAQGLRIQDYTHGKPGEHERHACYKYAHANEHGLGRGVYPVNTRKIRHPHPRCRSTLHLVLVEKLK